eukprot:763223-Hanusia_phi.AAC.1
MYFSSNLNVALRMLSLMSCKTAFTKTFERFLDVDMRQDAITRGHYCKRRCGRVRLNNFVGKKRVVDKFFNNLWKTGEQEKPIIAYGNASFASTGRCQMVVIRREYHKRYQTVDVDEFSTTNAVGGAEVSCQMYNDNRFSSN